ncbi:MAG: phage portal protein [Sphaerotilus natans subsp. sulfidivorans]|uniref:phage portal protein n=1 Tax=Sphaerotilus sulfidivorans TaxID=639200 RepID=UPI0023571900|nr:phage portal protein [Sphaerotilus sulfidivorans]MCK6401265.1 phage portal protein [Sphaerotilus sulfidivorans]
MSFFNRITGWSRKADAGSGGATPLSSPTLGALLAAVFGGGATKSGASVTVDSALQVSVVLACVRVIAEGIAQVPFRVMRESPDNRTRLPARQHPLWDKLGRKPNRWQTSFGLRETLAVHCVLTGNAYAYLSRVGARGDKIAEIIALDPKRVLVEATDDGTLTYKVTSRTGAEVRTLTERDIWHWRGPSWDGLIGMDVLRLARESIGLAMATEETQAALHAKGVRPSGVYSVEGTLSEKQYGDLKAWMTKEFGGAAAAGAPMILDRSAKWLPTTMTGVDAQHLETRKHQIEEVCRVFRLLPIMAGQADKAATYASAEAMFLAHLVHTLLPWYERIEQSADCHLLTDAERAEGYYTHLDPAGLLRGALKDTAEYLYKLVSLGVLTGNEAREMLDRNPIDGLDTPLTMTNMLPAGQGATT